ncbi:MAG: hypothetical protein SFX74_13370 [Fimbriimonadaceae bacterium]|nr:hypothetical protein [Fimbriimonadaceae bacterium]
MDPAPCRHMESLLQSAADGSSRGWRRWYALAHAARCKGCGNFLQRLRLTLRYLATARKEPSDAVRQRLINGRWVEEDAKNPTGP